jgi:hypothetical protein
MKRDRNLFATSAFGLLLALPYPGSSLARDMLPAAAGIGPQVGAGTILLAQNEPSPDDNQKKRHGRGKGQEEGGGHAGQRSGPAREGQEGRQNQGRQEQEGRGGQGKHEGERQHQPQRLNSAAPAEKAPEAGRERNKQRQYRLAPSPAKPQAEQPSAPQEEQAPRQQRKQERGG